MGNQLIYFFIIVDCNHIKSKTNKAGNRIIKEFTFLNMDFNNLNIEKKMKLIFLIHVTII